MATARALQLCPQLVLLPPDFGRYRAASRQILAIYRDYTPLVEPLSLDEAYLDVTGVDRCRGSATLMAQEIRARIRAEVGITASAGIAPNKFIAKVASDWNKPDGQFLVAPQDVDAKHAIAADHGGGLARLVHADEERGRRCVGRNGRHGTHRDPVAADGPVRGDDRHAGGGPAHAVEEALAEHEATHRISTKKAGRCQRLCSSDGARHGAGQGRRLKADPC